MDLGFQSAAVRFVHPGGAAVLHQVHTKKEVQDPCVGDVFLSAGLWLQGAGGDPARDPADAGLVLRPVEHPRAVTAHLAAAGGGGESAIRCGGVADVVFLLAQRPGAYRRGECVPFGTTAGVRRPQYRGVCVSFSGAGEDVLFLFLSHDAGGTVAGDVLELSGIAGDPGVVRCGTVLPGQPADGVRPAVLYGQPVAGDPSAADAAQDDHGRQVYVPEHHRSDSGGGSVHPQHVAMVCREEKKLDAGRADDDVAGGGGWLCDVPHHPVERQSDGEKEHQ